MENQWLEGAKAPNHAQTPSALSELVYDLHDEENMALVISYISWQTM